MSNVPSFDEYVAETKITRASKWLLANPEVRQLAEDLLDEGKNVKTVSRYLTEYYGWPFKAEALVNNLERLRELDT